MTKIFHVNWFRQDKNGAFIWPGFGDNLRVLRWVLDRCQGKGQAVESPIGYLPAPGAIDTAGLDISPDTMKALCSIDHHQWHDEMDNIKEFFQSFGGRMPKELWAEHDRIDKQLPAG